MIEDQRLKIFRAVEREGSFTLAAASLGISQPAVSQNIAELEKAAGRKLFLRSSHSVQLTDDGREFSEYVAQIEYWYAVLNDAFLPEIPALASRSRRTRLNVAIDKGYEPYFVPAGTPGTDIEIAEKDGNLRVSILARRKA